MIKKYKPKTPSRRFLTNVDYSGLSKDRRFKPLTKRVKTYAGRNSGGTISVRHQGGGNKKIYRLLDFKQNKFGLNAVIETIEYDPYRTAFISRILYSNGARRYILTPYGLRVGAKIIFSDEASFDVGNRTRLRRIPVGTFVHNVELFPDGGGKLARSAGSSLQILANEDGYTHLKLPSGEIRKVPWDAWGSIGQVSNNEHNLVQGGKAGRSRWLGIRPTVRGSAMNPRDHPYGGGEGRQKRGTKRPKTKWGKITGGRRTRNKKKSSSKLIIKRRR